jgi:hypothetical protein
MSLKPKETCIPATNVLSQYKTLLTEWHQIDVRTTRYPGEDSSKVGTKIRRPVEVAQLVYFACELKARSF